jgi:phenylalanyl-tRNA synthetase alpha chain
MAEGLQQLILDTLHADSTIPDTRLLVIPGQSEPAASQDAQIIILGALNSLLSRDVGPCTVSFCLKMCNPSIDGQVRDT